MVRHATQLGHLLLAALASLVLPSLSQGCSGNGLSVSKGKLYSSGCKEIVMRGINYPLAWFRQHNMDHGQNLANIKMAGANTVRIVLSMGKHQGSAWARIPGSEVSDIIGKATSNGLLVVIDCHDSTGWPENGAAAEPKECIKYWLSNDIKSAVKGTEDKVIVNIVNEPYGNRGVPSPHPWPSFFKNAVKKLRAAGYKNTLMIDGPNWAQDFKRIMLNNAEAVANADPDKNTMFDVHMYDQYGSASTVSQYLDAFRATGQAIIVGEFASDLEGRPVDEKAILQYGAKHNIGYIGWSWSGNTDGSLDMVQGFNPSKKTPWGNTFLSAIKSSGGSGLGGGGNSGGGGTGSGSPGGDTGSGDMNNGGNDSGGDTGSGDMNGGTDSGGETGSGDMDKGGSDPSNGVDGGEDTAGDSGDMGKGNKDSMFEGRMKRVGGGQSCTKGYVPKNFVPVALSKQQYEKGANCGSCVSACVQKGNGEDCFYGFVDQVCWQCGDGELGYKQGGGRTGKKVTWEWMPCDSKNIKFEKAGGNPWAGSVRVKGGPSGVRELKCGGEGWTGPGFSGVWRFSGGGGKLGCAQQCMIAFADGTTTKAKMPAGINGKCNK